MHYVAEKPLVARGLIHERLKDGRQSHRYVVCLDRLGTQKCSGRLLLNLKGHKHPIVPGTPVAFYSKILPNRKPLNPGQFDYAAYLENQSIPAQAYVDSSLLVTGKPIGTLRHQFDRLRQRAMRGLAKSGMSSESLSILNALVLGQRQELDRELVKDYEVAGAVHILSVSGLHVGFVMMALSLVMKPLPRNRQGRAIRLSIQLIFLWAFAVLTGLSPSVVRSATMFSLLAIGDSLRRPQNRFHTLMASALIILMADPSLLWDVGFQLSYSAVTFILWLYPVLKSMWEPGNALVKYIRDLLAVSIAAQLGTLPFCLLYFHQFPGLFLVTNLVVIPLVTIIMLAGMLSMTIATITFVPKALILITEWSIALMNQAISTIASVDVFAFGNIPFSLSMAVALAGAIISAGIFISAPSRGRAILVMVTVLAIQVTVLFEKSRAAQSSELIVFNDRKSPLIAVRHGLEIRAHSDSLNEYLLKPYRLQSFASIARSQTASDLLYYGGKKILLTRGPTPLVRLRPDVVILSGSPKLNLERALLTWKPSVVIADGTNYKSYISRWKSTCIKQKIPFHSTSEKGYFKISG